MAAVICDGSYAAAKALVGAGADVRARRSADQFGLVEGEQALALAIGGGDRRTIEFLIERGASINPTNSFSPLQSAALYGDLTYARRLLAIGADPNANPDMDKAGHTLNSALFGGHGQVAVLLVEHGADLHRPSSAPYSYGTPPMVFATYNESGEATLARLLSSRGLDVNTSNEEGVTPLN